MYIVQFQKISILHPQKELEFPGGWGFCKAYKFKEMYEDELEFPTGLGGSYRTSLPWGRYGYFHENKVKYGWTAISLVIFCFTKRNFFLIIKLKVLCCLEVNRRIGGELLI